MYNIHIYMYARVDTEILLCMKLAKHKYERVLQKMAQDTKAPAAGLTP